MAMLSSLVTQVDSKMQNETFGIGINNIRMLLVFLRGTPPDLVIFWPKNEILDFDHGWLFWHNWSLKLTW